jgi:translation elongation factor EF-G
MERYLGGEDIDQSVLIEDLEKAVARASFFPVIPACSGTGVGTLELLEIITSAFPSPPEHRLPEVFTPQGKTREGLACDPHGPLLAEVVKTTSDPYVGRVSLVRVFSGTQARRDGSRVGPFQLFFRLGRFQLVNRPHRPRRGRTDRHAVVPARQAATARAVGGRR